LERHALLDEQEDRYIYTRCTYGGGGGNIGVKGTRIHGRTGETERKLLVSKRKTKPRYKRWAYACHVVVAGPCWLTMSESEEGEVKGNGKGGRIEAGAGWDSFAFGLASVAPGRQRAVWC
jgi:hypothetical protein